MQKPKHREGGKEFSRAKFENITAVLNRCIQNDFCGRAQNLPDIWGETGKLIEASQSGDLRDPHFSVTFVGSMRISVVYCMIAGNWNLRGNYVLKLIRKKKVQTEKNVKPKTWSNILGLSLLVHQTTHFSQMIRFVPRHLTRYFHNIGKSAIFCVKTRPFSNSILWLWPSSSAIAAP